MILPKELIQRLHTAEGEHILAMETASGEIRLAPRDQEISEQMKIAEEGMARYRKTLRILAK